MAVTLSSIQDYLNQYLGDTSNNSVTANDRVRAISESIKSVHNEFGFNQINKSYTLNYYDTVNTYDITTALPDFLEPVDIRRQPPDHLQAFTRKTPREMMVNIDLYGNTTSLAEESFAVEQTDGKRTLIVMHQSKYGSTVVDNCSSLTTNGTWAADTTGSDASGLALDTVVFQFPSTASISFNTTVGQSVNNLATVYNPGLPTLDFTNFYNLGSMVFWIYLPDVTYVTSIKSYWGSDTAATPSTKANYYSNSVTTDIQGNGFIVGWNRIAIPWSSATTTGSPIKTSIKYIQFDVNYSASQTSKTLYRLDDIRMIRPEPLTLHYESWSVGTTTGGTTIYTFTTTTDIPFFSGQYDFFDIYCAHYAASILFDEMGLAIDAQRELNKANNEKAKLKKKFPTQRLTQTKSFGVKSINLRRRKI